MMLTAGVLSTLLAAWLAHPSGPAPQSALPADLLTRPLTPGAVALLVLNASSSDVERRLAEALRDARPSVRAVAARVALVNAVRGLTGALAEALERESDPSAASEQVRALLALTDGETAAAAVAAGLRMGGPAALAVAEALARTRGAEILTPLPPLLLRSGNPAGLADVLSVVARDRPAERRRLAEGVIAIGDGPLWRAYLANLAERRVVLDAATWLSALQAPDPVVRTETLLALAARVVDDQPVDEAVRVAALPPESWPPASPLELDLARELAARAFKRSASAADWSALVAGLGSRLPPALWSKLTDREREAARQGGFVRGGRGAGEDYTPPLSPGSTPEGRPARIAQSLAPGLWAELATLTGCRFGSGPQYAAATMTYHPTGRPREVRLMSRSIPDRCFPFATAVFNLTVARIDHALAEEASDLVYLPLHSDVVRCLDGLRSSMAGPAADIGETGVTMPKLSRAAKPNYTPEAMRARAEGEVWLRAVVNEEGCVSSAGVVRSLHPDLDLEALHAVLQWKFKPALRAGRPVAVAITVAVSFQLGQRDRDD
jgi:TonB family protein